jgi:hypothetical protein
MELDQLFALLHRVCKGDHMNRIQKWIIFCVVVFLVTNGAFYAAFADHDEKNQKRWYQKIFDWDEDDYDDDDHDRGEGKRRYRKRYRNGSEHYGKRYLPPVNNPTYIEHCGACHFAYQPELLPSGSWEKILAGLDDHFGESLELDDDSKRVILDYLKPNSAEYSSAKRAVKIVRSLGKQVTLRITDVPYIREKHHEISPDVLKRESIGSLSNCVACHTTAEKGIYEDDNVKIPK